MTARTSAFGFGLLLVGAGMTAAANERWAVAGSVAFCGAIFIGLAVY